MAKPILFDTISREKFDTLSDEVKAKKNYQIKEVDGSITKHIGGLEGGESELPTVTSDDNGNILTVVEGVWDKAEAPSGNNDFVVTYTYNEETEQLETETTFAEISSAFESGKNIIAKDDSDVYYLQYCSDGDCYFINFNHGSTNELDFQDIEHKSTNTIITHTGTITYS